MTSQSNALRRPHHEEAPRNEEGVSANRRVVTAQEVASWIRNISSIEELRDMTTYEFALRLPYGVTPSVKDFQPLSLITRDKHGVMWHVPYLNALGISVSHKRLQLAIRHSDVVVGATPLMSREVTELHIDRSVIRFLRYSRLAYGESIY